ncbi:saccharopine dehydrogenase NADP-binding domain-containing protein [Amycolatopsis acidiphila]|uniref:Saccharopine dehydrogenase n=1 Tax=Amycolatopsis acidiphila TaxID=715473 RepID=A0A558AHA3_9PSEU|nr:saccharopine dehydrogenase NADP-binding domain-containing protein [Amycolatopsis acidiphila]TVT23626.1 saccharopine dehydrogenase [Amycolatopsis acidiphila]UIJ58612.1 saccharopine dehydrogenase NADP-binding domain-containing protein [Amycolatopsis acidiphila]GHG76492.1 saccharopine dehydrogenase [Amycolatopsis acidiphila]
MAEQRGFDLVLFGATGFTGGLTAEYLARHLPEGGRWALAGRNPEKLAAMRDRLGPRWAELPLLHADVTDPKSLEEVAASAKVVITTVGPYLLHGEPLVAACAKAGTDYVDLTGEPEFFDRTYVRHHRTAERTGARIVHACGFDSVPHDLGVFYTVKQLPAGVPLRISGQVRTGATFSGGTYASALTVFSRLLPMVRAARERARAEPKPAGRRVRAETGKPHRDPGTGRWLAPLTTIDPQVVALSGRLLESYGPDFGYSHYVSFKRLPTVAGAAAGMGALAVLAQIPPVRRALSNLQKPGSGPSEERRARSWFKVRFVGEGGGKRVVTEVAGGDPGYDETAKMLAESAMCLAFDDLPPTAGQVTTAAAMGDALLARLVDAGLMFRVVL